EVSLDFSVLIFTLVISMLAGLIFGALPAQFTARKMVDALREGGRSSGSHARSRMRNALVVAQVAFSIVLLVGAGLMLRSFVKLISVPPGFNPENVLTARLTLNFSKFNTNESIRGFYNRLLTKLDGRPEIKAKGVLSTIPLATGTGRFTSRFQIEGRMIADRAQQPVLDQRVASPGYFQAVGQPLVHGRLFNDFDNEKSTQVALINQSLARRHWSKDDPVGKRFTLDNGDHWVTIVGVVGDVKQYGLDREVVDEAYIPLAQGPFANSIFIRTAGDPMQLARFLRQTVYEVDSTVPIDRVRTLEAVKTESVAMPRLTAALMGMFAGLALLITATGIAGVMALSVSQRTHEIGIRMALGATPGNVLRMILGQGLLVTGVGAIAGLAGAAALTGLMRTLLFGVEPTDPVTFGGVALLLLLSATLACAMPARRAALIQPIQALHVE
ncbi:MAG: ABC transporter permease, partial [Acidobacteria bacterium]|nr:ABC transporter permease [Acidobacteriota bacterium]